MNPREIQGHIEELILHGFAPGTRWDVAEALERELRGLLSERGIPDGWCASPKRMDAGRFARPVNRSPHSQAGRLPAPFIKEGSDDFPAADRARSSGSKLVRLGLASAATQVRVRRTGRLDWRMQGVQQEEANGSANQTQG